MTPKELETIREIFRKDNYESWIYDEIASRRQLKLDGNEDYAEAIFIALAKTRDSQGTLIFGLDFPLDLLPSLVKNIQRELAKINIPPGATGI